jgi:hypothetical protein
LIARTAMALILASGPALAQVVEDCDWRASLAAIPEPWESATRTFANGDVRLTVTDTVEPAAGAFHLVVQSPPLNELGERQCKVVSAGSGMGFAFLTLEEMEPGYDPATGLRFVMTISRPNPQADAFFDGTLSVTLNQATGAITALVE